jgi:hypothetical protein
MAEGKRFMGLLLVFVCSFVRSRIGQAGAMRPDQLPQGSPKTADEANIILRIVGAKKREITNERPSDRDSETGLGRAPEGRLNWSGQN